MKVNDGRVVTNFLYQALNNEDITIYGDGSQTRSLAYVTDTVEYLFRLMKSEYRGVVNIGNPEEISIIDLAKKIIKKTNSNSKIVHLDLPEDDPKKRKPDISLAVEELGYSPVVTLDEGLSVLIQWLEEKKIN